LKTDDGNETDPKLQAKGTFIQKLRNETAAAVAIIATTLELIKLYQDFGILAAWAKSIIEVWQTWTSWLWSNIFGLLSINVSEDLVSILNLCISLMSIRFAGDLADRPAKGSVTTNPTDRITTMIVVTLAVSVIWLAIYQKIVPVAGQIASLLAMLAIIVSAVFAARLQPILATDVVASDRSHARSIGAQFVQSGPPFLVTVFMFILIGFGLYGVLDWLSVPIELLLDISIENSERLTILAHTYLFVPFLFTRNFQVSSHRFLRIVVILFFLVVGLSLAEMGG